MVLIGLFYLSLFNSNINAQKKVGQIWHCNTADNLTPGTISNLSIESITSADTSLKIINVFIHIIRRSDGTGGLTDAQVNNWMTRLCNDYSIHKILIREIGRSGLNNTTFYNGMTDNNYNTLINTDTHNNAIDIYLLSPTDTYSRASGIPGIALAVGGGYQGTSVLSHEFGHCLGLYHTHSGRGCNDYANCSENINGSNCSTCGDLVCDTPADPCLAGNVDTDCNYIGDPSFAPDVHNIMSYAPPICLSHITVGQTLRIHASILNNYTIFDARSYKPYISGPNFNLVCSSGGTFTVNNLPPSGWTISWNKSANLTLQSTSGNTAVFKANAGANSSGWVEATITTCGSVALPQFIVWVGTPQITNQKVDGSSYYAGMQICPGNHSLRVTPVGGNAGTATWTVPPGITYFVGTNTLDFTFPSSAISVTILARSANSCGTGVNYSFYLIKKTYGCYLSLGMSLYPNPASDNVTITMFENPFLVENDDSSLAKMVVTEVNSEEPITYTINIYNNQSIIINTMTRSGNSFNIPLVNMSDGTYIIEVSDGKNLYRQQLIVKHN